MKNSMFSLIHALRFLTKHEQYDTVQLEFKRKMVTLFLEMFKTHSYGLKLNS